MNGISDYSMEELLPIVRELAEKYTSKESSSITNDCARTLMKAVLYCINHSKENFPKKTDESVQLDSKEKCSAKIAYQIGYRCVCEKVEMARCEYNQMIQEFQSYGNLNYEEVVKVALPGFFYRYNPKFLPQDSVITMDYPTLIPVVGTERSGIDAIEKYIHCIYLEQKILQTLDSELVVKLLTNYREDYRNHFFNLLFIIERNILAALLIGKSRVMVRQSEDNIMLFEQVKKMTKDQLQIFFEKCIKEWVVNRFDGNEELEQYLLEDCSDFVYALKNIRQPELFRNVF